MSTLSFILAMPKRVMPSTSPLYVITSASSMLLQREKVRTVRTPRKHVSHAPVAHVDAHAVGLHGGVDLVNDAVARRLDTECALRLHHVVSGRGRGVDALRAHDRLQVCPFNQQIEASATQIVDHSTLNRGDALNDDFLQRGAQRLQRENLFQPIAVWRQHVDHVRAHDLRRASVP